MQRRASAPSRGRRWLRWARVLIVGTVCGGVQTFLLLATGLSLTPWLSGLPLHWPWAVVGALSACAYLGLGLLEGFLAATRNGASAAGRAAGQVVGGISALIVAIPIVVLIVIMPTTPLSTAGEIDPRDLRPSIAFILCVLIVLEALWAWGMSTLGGWIGGVMSQRKATPPAEPA